MVRVTQKQRHDVESHGGGTRGNFAQESSQTQPQSTATTSSSPLRLVGSIVFSVISVLLSVLFVLAIVGGDDGFLARSDWPSPPPVVIWIVFEVLNAALPILFLAYCWVCFPVGILNLLTMAVNVWSIVYLVIIWISSRKDTVYDASVQILVYAGMFSSVYHSLLVRYWVRKSATTTAST